MILTETQILDLVLKPVDPVIALNKALQDDHKVHIQGTGFKDVLHRIIGYENVEQFEQKKLLTEPFTRPLFKKILNAQSRWKKAWGTTKFYKFKSNSENLSKEFKEQVLSQVWKNESIDTFVKEFLSRAIYEEFNGFFLIERPQVIEIEGKKYQVKDGIQRQVDGGEIKPYICFISVDDVYKFKLSGKTVEFMILRFGKEQRNGKVVELFRVIDDQYDYIVEKADGVTKISEKYPKLEHKAGRCPVVCVTYLNQKLTDDKTRTSPVDDIIKILDYYLHLFAEHLVSQILHAHPKFFQVGQRCIEVVEGIKCENGYIRGQHNGKEINQECPACKGSGHNLKFDASTILILPAVDQEGKPFNMSNVAGYITPPVDILTYQQKAIDWMEEKILESATGLNNFAQTEGLEKTATGVIANLRPLEDIISDIIDIIEGVERQLTDIIGKMYYGDKFVASEIIYGRKLTLRDENTLIEEIKKSKDAGVSSTHMKSLNEELTYSRFIRSNSDLQRNIILNELEPLIGYTAEQVEASQNISFNTKLLKLNFNDLIQRFELEHGGINEFMIGSDLPKKVQAIKAILDKYVSDLAIAIRATGQTDDSEGGANSDQNIPEDTVGKLPLAIQQLALAKFRAEESNDQALAAQLEKKMQELLKKIR